MLSLCQSVSSASKPMIRIMARRSKGASSAVAVLEFLAGAARAWIVAADLGGLAADRNGGEFHFLGRRGLGGGAGGGLRGGGERGGRRGGALHPGGAGKDGEEILEGV